MRYFNRGTQETKEGVALGHEIKRRQEFEEYVRAYLSHTDTGLPFVHGLNDFLDDLGAEMDAAAYERGIKK